MWTVLMQRYGDSEAHHYIQGVYSTEKDAKLAGEIEEAWRGGKYTALVQEFMLDAPSTLESINNWEQCK